ncbi:hypothetical protein COOONC_15851 [Cooperia oncophora]
MIAVPRLLVTFTDFRRLTCPQCHRGFENNLGCAVVIKPTRGDFHSYRMGDDLHIGISNSMSVVHSYWMNGISSECTGWDKSIAVCRFGDDEDRFDVMLSSFLRENADSFDGKFYDDRRWNCFDFVLEFLRFINFRRYTKIDFAAEFVQDSLKSAVKYNMLVQRVEEHLLNAKSLLDVKLTVMVREFMLWLAVIQMPNNEVISDMLQKMRDIGGRLSEALKQLQAEFSTKTIPLPEFDPADMHLLLGEEEVPKILTPFEEVEESERAAHQQLESLLFEAEVMLREYEHLKQGLRA